MKKRGAIGNTHKLEPNPRLMIKKLISGGQTGADRAALDWAIFREVAHGGWCPKGRRAEDGPIPVRYHLRQTKTSNYLERTERNVLGSDGTIIFTMKRPLIGGSKRTAHFASRHGKPWLHLYPGANYDPAGVLLDFINANKISVLNVAGSRESKEPEVGGFVKRVLEEAFYPAPSSMLGGRGEG
jgi:hypothetical protein